ncbi:MAG: B12-binding domain-containing radical SAM protein [Methanosarcinaceae archaeon]
MAVIVFVQNIFREYPAFMALSSFIRQNGHKAQVVVARGEKDIVKAIMLHKPKLIGFSPTAYDIDWCITCSEKLKKEGIEIIFGGAMVTGNQDVIYNPAVDFVCIGEGELCLYKLLDLKDKKGTGNSYDSIPNLVYKKSKRIFYNQVVPMFEDLDSLGIPDHNIYRRYRQITNSTTSIFTFMRGCKFNCSFCFNHVIQKAYGNKPFIVRRRSPQSSVKEIEITLAERNRSIKIIRLFDSTFLSDIQWARKFLKLYRERIALPFVCFAHPSEVNEEISCELRKSNCIEVGFSIESGSSYIRNNILKKGISEKQIFRAVKALKRSQIPFVTFNMLGSPGESFQDILKTIEINTKIKPMLAWGSLTQVYNGTNLERITKKMCQSQIRPNRIYGVLNYEHERQAQLLRIQDAFPFIIKYPKVSRVLLANQFANKSILLRVMAFIGFFMQCLRPSLSFKEFLKNYLMSEDRGVGYY